MNHGEMHKVFEGDIRLKQVVAFLSSKLSCGID
jgi:hypothetical protein